MAPPGDNGGGLERGDLIRPTGAVLKVIHSDDPEDKAGPKFEASFEVRGTAIGKEWGREVLLRHSVGVLTCLSTCWLDPLFLVLLMCWARSVGGVLTRRSSFRLGNWNGGADGVAVVGSRASIPG